MTATTACRLCGQPARLLFERTVLGRYPAGYYQCEACGLTQTATPTWLEEAYADALHPTDTGLLERNRLACRVAATFLHLCGVGDRPCLDYAAGYGVFVRLMRDAGFRFHWMDPYATNLFARGFEWRDDLGPPVACTAFEVLEHLVQPLEEFRRIASHGADWIITSTRLHPGPRPAQDWEYLSVESGQHVAFYRADTLRRLGQACGYPHVLAGPTWQVFARAPFPAWRWRAAERWNGLLFPAIRRLRPSLTLADCETLRRGLRSP